MFKKIFFSYVLLLPVQENMKRVPKIKGNTQRIYIMHTKIQMYNSNRFRDLLNDDNKLRVKHWFMYSEENGLHHMLRVQCKTGIEHRESYYMYCSSLKLRDDFAMA